MKKNVFIISLVLITLSLTAYGFMRSNQSATDIAATVIIDGISEVDATDKDIDKKSVKAFLYDVGPRFNHIKKKDLINLRSFDDYIGQVHAQRIVAYKSLSVILLDNDKQTDTKLTTDSGIFSSAQLELMKSFDYSTNLLLYADYTEKWKESDKIVNSSWTPYLTIVPETQASYNNGEESSIDYLKHNSKENIENITQDKLQSGQIFFTVTKKGLVSNIEIATSSGYPLIDEKIKDLISKSSGNWEAAKTMKGEKIDQTLTVFFGRMGC